MIEAVIAPLVADPMLEMSTVCVALQDRSDYANPNVVKVVKDRAGGRCTSRARPSAVPDRIGIRSKTTQSRSRSGSDRYKHIGLYGFRRRSS
jgi:CMP-2-keto-3-deoxyoctulosonic acid synthetase